MLEQWHTRLGIKCTASHLPPTSLGEAFHPQPEHGLLIVCCGALWFSVVAAHNKYERQKYIRNANVDDKREEKRNAGGGQSTRNMYFFLASGVRPDHAATSGWNWLLRSVYIVCWTESKPLVPWPIGLKT